MHFTTEDQFPYRSNPTEIGKKNELPPNKFRKFAEIDFKEPEEVTPVERQEFERVTAPRRKRRSFRG